MMDRPHSLWTLCPHNFTSNHFISSSLHNNQVNYFTPWILYDSYHMLKAQWWLLSYCITLPISIIFLTLSTLPFFISAFSSFLSPFFGLPHYISLSLPYLFLLSQFISSWPFIFFLYFLLSPSYIFLCSKALLSPSSIIYIYFSISPYLALSTHLLNDTHLFRGANWLLKKS